MPKIEFTVSDQDLAKIIEMFIPSGYLYLNISGHDAYLDDVKAELRIPHTSQIQLLPKGGQDA